MRFLHRTAPLPFWSVLTVALAVFLLKAVFILSSTAQGLATTTWIIDDSFIIMRVARNIALGYGFSYDAIHPTTGAPFLWTYLTSILHLLFAQEGAIKATFVISTLAGSLATLVVYVLAKHVTGRSAVAWIAFLLATFSGNAFLEAMNGMETALFTLLVLLTIATFLGLGKPNLWPPFAWGCVTGLCAGLTLLTRADGIFVLGPLLLIQIIELLRAKQRLERARIVQLLGGILLAAGLCFMILMIWQMSRTGSPFPANQVGRRELSLALHGFSFDAFDMGTYLRIVVWNIFQLEHLLTIATGGTILCLLGLAFGLSRRETQPLGIITLLYTSTFFGMLVIYQWYFPDFHGLRYINPAVHLLFIFVAAVLWQCIEEKKRKSIIPTLLTCILILAAYLPYQLASRVPWAKDQSMIARPTSEQLYQNWAQIDWLREKLPPGTVIGVRDHGRTAMFSGQPIQDLAGNIDPNVPMHLKDGSLPEYLSSRNVQYLFIPSKETRPDLLYQVIYSQLSLTKVEEMPATSKAHLYKIDWPE